jgi:hypothetical protein
MKLKLWKQTKQKKIARAQKFNCDSVELDSWEKDSKKRKRDLKWVKDLEVWRKTHCEDIKESLLLAQRRREKLGNRLDLATGILFWINWWYLHFEVSKSRVKRSVIIASSWWAIKRIRSSMGGVDKFSLLSWPQDRQTNSSLASDRKSDSRERSQIKSLLRDRKVSPKCPRRKAFSHRIVAKKLPSAFHSKTFSRGAD